ncbi:hypothetical protein TNCV_6221 [Trichonephila clavipes]|nr:hypothetical protein TNCV_6221 [Trichonephila clavipes]
MDDKSRFHPVRLVDEYLEYLVSSRSRAKRHLRAQAQLSESRTETLGLLRKREKSEQRKTEVREQAFPSRIHGNPSVRIDTF